MKLLIDPAPPVIKWCEQTAKGYVYGESPSAAGLPGIAEGSTNGRRRITSVAYRLRHGGELVRLQAQRVTPEVMNSVRDSIKFLPEYNELTYTALSRMMRALPDIPHILLCDTAFFTAMPQEASSYALPPLLRARGIRRYGDQGLTHQWAYVEAQRLTGGAAGRTVTIQLGDHPNMAAIGNGRPLDSTVGFTPVEGLPSHTACGDIDPAVVFELQAAGFSLGEINDILSAKSGFRALTGRPCSFLDLLAPGADGKKALGRKILLYDVIRNVGAFSALLGGADAIVFIAERPAKCAAFIADVCRGLEFMGLRCRRTVSGRTGGAVISDRNSMVKVLVLKDDLWRIMDNYGKIAVEEVV